MCIMCRLVRDLFRVPTVPGSPLSPHVLMCEECK